LSIDLTSKEIILQSDVFGLFDVVVEVYLANYPKILALSESFRVEVVDCGDISITPIDESAPT